MSIPNIINELARVTDAAIHLQSILGREQVVVVTVPEAQQILQLWRDQQDDGK